jgi:hypothetical protein
MEKIFPHLTTAPKIKIWVSNPGSEIREKKYFPDSGSKKTRDPESGFATLDRMNFAENHVKISPVFQRRSSGASVQPQCEISLRT